MKTRTAHLEIAGQVLQLQFKNPPLDYCNAFDRFFSSFLLSDRNGLTEPHLILDIELTPKLFKADTEPEVREKDRHLEILFRGARASLALDQNTGCACIWNRITALESLLRIILTHRLCTRQGFLLHACALETEKGQSHLFSGPSTSGKSTLMGKAPPEHAIGDETIAVLKSKDMWMAYATPFRGSWPGKPQPGSFPIKDILFLERRNILERLSVTPTQAFRLLIPRILYFHFNRESIQSLMTTAIHFLEETPASRFSFLKEMSWEEISSLFETEHARV